MDILRNTPPFLEKILNVIGLKIIRPLKSESEMTNSELLYYAEWASSLDFRVLTNDFVKELEKRGLLKREL